MPIVSTRYACAICGTVFDDAPRAEACEARGVAEDPVGRLVRAGRERFLQIVRSTPRGHQRKLDAREWQVLDGGACAAEVGMTVVFTGASSSAPLPGAWREAVASVWNQLVLPFSGLVEVPVGGSVLLGTEAFARWLDAAEATRDPNAQIDRAIAGLAEQDVPVPATILAGRLPAPGVVESIALVVETFARLGVPMDDLDVWGQPARAIPVMAARWAVRIRA